jgi:hypothetical protein
MKRTNLVHSPIDSRLAPTFDIHRTADTVVAPLKIDVDFVLPNAAWLPSTTSPESLFQDDPSLHLQLVPPH